MPDDEAARLRLARFRGPNWEPMLETSAADKVARDCACVACERDGQHAPHCAVHGDDDTNACDCPRRGMPR